MGLKSYVDNNFRSTEKGDVTWYVPYEKDMPTPQVKLLELWDELGILHAERKQVWGSPLQVIGFDVDPNTMTVCMCLEKCAKLVATCQTFTAPSARFPLCKFWALQGLLNWALSVYPLLCLALSALYEKTVGKTLLWALVCMNLAIIHRLHHR
jgi:hypothetical protein